jgi:hypothetical protein
MTEALDKVLAAHDRIDRVHKFFKSIGSTDEQAATAAAAHADKFVWNGATLEFQGKPVADPDNGVREWFTANKLDFLLPPKSADKLDVDPALLASARAGNMTAKSRLFVQVGRDRAKLDAVLADKSNTGADEAARDAQGRFVGATPQEKEAAKNNPWSAEPGKWNATRQGQIVRSLGIEAAQRIAKAAGSYVGAVRPAKVA